MKEVSYETIIHLKESSIEEIYKCPYSKNPSICVQMLIFAMFAGSFASYLKYQWCLRLAKIALLVMVVMTRV